MSLAFAILSDLSSLTDFVVRHRNVLVFFYGLAMLALFGWYFFTDSERVKRALGTLITVMLAALCVMEMTPPFDKKVDFVLQAQEPATQTGDQPAKIDLKVDDVSEFTVRDAKNEKQQSADLIKKISVGDTVSVEDGAITMKVLTKTGDRIRCKVLTPGTMSSQANGSISKAGKIQLGLDLKGGTSFLIQLIAEDAEVTNEDGTKTIEKRYITPSMVDQAVEVIRKRVDKLGTSEPVITPSGTDRILVQIPGLSTEKLQDTREQLQKVAKLEFRKVHADNAGILSGQVAPDPNYIRMAHVELEKGKEIDRGEIVVRKTVDMPGKHVVRAGAAFEAKGWIVHLNFDSIGGDIFGKLTTEVYKERSQLAIVLDGKVISAPGVNDGPILGGRCEISGGFDEAGARNLASALENPLQTPVKIIEERSESASLGQDAIDSGIYSGLLGLGLIWLSVLFYYRLAGLVALIALAVEGLLLFGFLAMTGAVLTLPGIAGTILTLGMAIDANVLIYERLREEVATGKTLKASLDASYNKAFSAIFDSHVTTLITAAILYAMATGPVKGFAVTLTIGIIASMFTALVITRNLFLWMFHFKLLKKITMADLIGKTHVDFLGQRRPAILASLVVIALLSVTFGIRGGHNFGVDFRGGDRLVLEAQGQKVSEEQVRLAIEEIGIADNVVQTEKSPKSEFLTIRTPHDTSEKVDAHLKAKFPEAQFKTEGTEKVGSLVGDELIKGSIIALVLGLVGIMIYVAVQFEFSFAVGALLALIHDIAITIGLYSLAGREISLIFVGAVLTIAGYSVNDKIVVFDRIREGIRARRRGSISQIMNNSINETLSRTLLTGGTTLLALAALYFLGGPVLNDFAFAIFIGVVVGTYSSIYIAAPIVLWWSGKSGADLAEEIRRSEAQDEVVA